MSEPRERWAGQRDEPGDDAAVYIISVAAELAGVHPQTLRFYEKKGLLNPARSRGTQRRYSDRDIARMRAIQHLTQDEGINLAGAKMIMEMQVQLEEMQERMLEMQRMMRRAREQAREQTGLVPLRDIPLMPWQEGLMR
ncbi:MAG: helix-turn-helix transcriptional regulator [Actinomycetota bacterium]